MPSVCGGVKRHDRLLFESVLSRAGGAVEVKRDHTGVLILSTTRKRLIPAPVALAAADNRHPGEGVRTTGIRASGQVDTRVDRQPLPAIFRRLRDLRLPASVAKSPCGGIGRRARLK